MSIAGSTDVLVTEDGHPMGQLVIADNTCVAETRPTETEVANARLDLLRESVRDLTGELTADEAIVDLYPGFFDDEKKRKAMRLFVTETRSVEEAARAVGVPPHTVAQWVFIGRWDTLLRHDIAARGVQANLELERIRINSRVDIMKEQLEQAKMIRKKAARNIEEDVGSLKSNTEAWSTAARVEHTIVGISESGDVTSMDAEDTPKEKQAENKTPFVMIFQGGSLPPQPTGGRR